MCLSIADRADALAGVPLAVIPVFINERGAVRASVIEIQINGTGRERGVSASFRGLVQCAGPIATVCPYQTSPSGVNFEAACKEEDEFAVALAGHFQSIHTGTFVILNPLAGRKPPVNRVLQFVAI